MRLRLNLGYDGTDFSGWAKQPGRRTVQTEVEQALTVVLRQPVRVAVAGRTDAGVHARGQVCHADVVQPKRSESVDLPPPAKPADLPWGAQKVDSAEDSHRMPLVYGAGESRPEQADARRGLDDSRPGEADAGAGLDRSRSGQADARPGVAPGSTVPPPVVTDALLRRLNGVLPLDVRVFAVAEAPPGFDARFSAVWRRYSYRVSDGVVDPLRRHDTVAHSRPLDLEALRAACPPLLGLRDFAAFCKRREGATTVRTLQHLDWRSDGSALVMDVRADAFCHSMVRALAGALLAVGDGRRDVGWPAQVLAGRLRRPDAHVAAAHGLVLEEVGYPGDDELAARAAATRRPRDPLDLPD